MKTKLSTVASLDIHQPMSDLSLRYAQSSLHRIGFGFDDEGLVRLAEHYRDRVFRAVHEAEEGKLRLDMLLLRFEDDVFVQLKGWGSNQGVVFAPTAERAAALYEEIKGVLPPEPPPEKDASFYLLRYEYNDFATSRVDDLPPASDDEFLRLCYGPDVLDWIGGFCATTRAKPGGITILEGLPGTGKTSLITQLMHRLAETHVFYALPSSHNEALSSPEMTPFWQRQNTRHGDRVKVIVLEDADRLLWRRGGDNREAVASLLNIADGLLGRMLRLHVICSVNSAMEDIDPAILRPGRLLNYRHFGSLRLAEARQVAARCGVRFEPDPNEEEFPLADVLNPQAYQPVLAARGRVGF